MRPKAKTNLEKMGFVDSDRNKNHDVLQLQILENPEKLVRAISKSEIKDLKIISIKLEEPVISQTNYNSSKFIVGYLDCVIFISFDGGEFSDETIVSYVEGKRVETIKRRKWKTERKICVEIKTKIESFGDTLRQINTYRQYQKDRNTLYVVASEDDRYKSQFESQDIRFYNFK